MSLTHSFFEGNSSLSATKPLSMLFLLRNTNKHPKFWFIIKDLKFSIAFIYLLLLRIKYFEIFFIQMLLQRNLNRTFWCTPLLRGNGTMVLVGFSDYSFIDILISTLFSLTTPSAKTNQACYLDVKLDTIYKSAARWSQKIVHWQGAEIGETHWHIHKMCWSFDTTCSSYVATFLNKFWYI